jgi:hypothetical protein
MYATRRKAGQANRKRHLVIEKNAVLTGAMRSICGRRHKSGRPVTL